MYQFTVVSIPEAWLDKVFPLPAPPGCTLHTAYGKDGKLICVWQRDPGTFIVDGWGMSEAVADPVSIENKD